MKILQSLDGLPFEHFPKQLKFKNKLEKYKKFCDTKKILQN